MGYRTLSAFSLRDLWPASWGASGKLVIGLTHDLVADDGKEYLATANLGTGNLSSLGFHWGSDITVTDGLATAAAIATLPATDTTLPPYKSPYRVYVYDAKGVQRLCLTTKSFHLQSSLPDVFTWREWVDANQFQVRPRAIALVGDYERIRAMIEERVPAPLASDLTAGLGLSDVPPVDPTRPIFLGTNSPLYARATDRRLLGITDAVQAGVKADAVLSTDGVILGGSLSTFSSASHSAVTADVGKKIVVYGAGSLSGLSGLNNALRTSVSGRSGNNFLLTAAATAAVSGARWVYGTDNTTAVQAILTGMSLTGAGGVLFFPPGSYVLGSVTVPSNVTIWAMPGTVTIYSVSNSVFVTSGGSNITVDGITIDACGNPTGNGGVTLVGGTTMTNLVVQRCIFKDTFLNGNVAPVTTFNRHGILARNYDTLNVRFCQFWNGFRIKAHGGTGNALNADIHDNYFNTCNENGFSLLDSTADGVARNINFHHNIFEGVMETGNCVVMGDDGFQLNVSSATNASPAVFTTSSSHGLVTGQRVFISGATGSWVAVNGVFAVTVTASNKVSIPVDSAAFGALSGTVRFYSTQEQSNISICNNIFRGPLKANTAFIQNRGSYLQRNIKFSDNIFDNTNGSALSGTFAINNAVQTVSGGQTINFKCCGNEAGGYFDQAVFRLGNIASGEVANNVIDATAQRGIRLGTVSHLKVHHNTINNCSYGIYLNAGTLDDIEVEHNTIRLPASNNVAGGYIESTVTPPVLTFRRNTIIGAGGSYTNVYGFEDATNGVGGVTAGVKYLLNEITNLNVTTGLGSFKYRTLPNNAVVTEPPAVTTPQLLSGTGQNNSATPDVRGSGVLREAYTSPTTVTAINNASPGVPFTILFTSSNVTLQNNASIRLDGGTDFPAQANDSITFVWNGSACVELSREVNSPSASYTTGATPDVRGKRSLTISYSGAGTITDFLNGVERQTLSILFTNGNATLQNNASIKLAGAANFVGTANDFLVLERRSGVWFERSRSLN